jgi:hypothetical protein
MSTENYCTYEIEIDLKEKSIKLPRLFLWYKYDFIYDDESKFSENDKHDQLLLRLAILLKKKNFSRINFKNKFFCLILRFVGDYIKKEHENYASFQNVLEKNDLNEIKVEFMSYDWTLNAKN